MPIEIIISVLWLGICVLTYFYGYHIGAAEAMRKFKIEILDDACARMDALNDSLPVTFKESLQYKEKSNE